MSNLRLDRTVLVGCLAAKMGFLDPLEVVERLLCLGDDPAAWAGLTAEQRAAVEAQLTRQTSTVTVDDTPATRADSFPETSPPEVSPFPDGEQRTSAPFVGVRYRVIRPHARGGLGQVLVAEDLELHREVALKEIQDRHADEPHNRRRFVLEAEITGGLEHPGIVPVYGLGTYPDGRPYYAMRFIRGESLNDAIESYHRGAGDNVVFRDLLRRFFDVCNALAYAHSRGVVHRDLKPGNVMLGNYGETLVVDWGLAKAMGTVDEPDEGSLQPMSATAGDLTLPGATLGTPAYMSPEQASGRSEKHGIAGDVYSLGATLYCLLTGRPPFRGNDLRAILDGVREGRFPRPREISPRVPAALEAVCLKAMALRPEDRYPSADELGKEIERWTADEPVSAFRENLPRRLARWARRHRAWSAGAAAALLAVALASSVGVVLVNHQREIAETLAEENDELAREEKAGREREQEERRKAERRAAELRFEQAYATCRQGDPGTGLLLLSRALGEARRIGHDDLDWTIRAHLAGWSRHQPELKAILPGAGSGTYNVVRLAPDGRTLLASSAFKRSRSAESSTSKGSVRLQGNPDDRTHLWNPADPSAAPRIWESCRRVTCADFTADGKTVVLGGMDGSVRLIALDTGKEIVAPFEHRQEVNVVAISPDGLTVVSGCRDGLMRWWDARTGKLLHEPMKVDRGVDRLAFIDRGKVLLVKSFRSEVRRWDVASGNPIGEPMKHDWAYGHWVVGRDERTLATMSREKPEVRVWDLATGGSRYPPLVHTRPVTAAALSPDGRLLLCGCEDGTLQLWDFTTGLPTGMPFAHEDEVSAVAFSPDGSLDLTGSTDRTARLWDAATGKQIGPPMRHEWDVTWVGFLSDRRTMATVGQDGIRVWDLGPEHQRGVPFPCRDGHVVRFDATGKHVIAADDSGIPRLLDPATGELLGPRIAIDGKVTRSAVSPDGLASVVAVEKAGVPRSWELRGFEVRTGRALWPVVSVRGEVQDVVFTPDGTSFLAGIGNPYTEQMNWGEVRRWETSTGRGGQLVLSLPSRPWSLTMRPDGKALVVTSWKPSDGRTGKEGYSYFRLWDLHEGEAVGEDRALKRSPRMFFSTDGKTLLAVGGSKNPGPFEGSFVALFDGATGEPLGPPRSEQGSLWLLGRPPETDIVLVGRVGGRVGRLDIRTGLPTGPVVQVDGEAEAAALGLDGRILATTSSRPVARDKQRGILEYWEAATGRALGGPRRFSDPMNVLHYRPDGRAVLIGSREGGTVQSLASPHPTECSPEEAIVRVEVAGGMELNAQGAPVNLDPEDHAARRLVLAAMSVPTGERADPVAAAARLKERCRRELEKLEKEGQHRASIWHLDRLVELEPENGEWLYRRAKARLALSTESHLDRPQETEADLTRAIGLGVNHWEAWWYVGKVRFGIGRTVDAVEALDTASKLKPDEAKVWFLLGAAHSRLDQPARAVEALTRAVDLKPDSAAYRDERGDAFVRLGDFDRAVIDFTELARRFPDRTLVRHKHALILLARGKAEDYRTLCKDLLASADRLVKADAKRTGSETTGRDKDNLDVANLFWTWVVAPGAVSDPARTAEMTEANLTGGRDVRRDRLLHGAALFRAGKYEQALQRLKDVRRESGTFLLDQGVIDLFLAMTLHRLDRRDEARKAYRDAVAWMAEKSPNTGKDALRPTDRDWHVQLRRELLRREAEEMLGLRGGSDR